MTPRLPAEPLRASGTISRVSTSLVDRALERLEPRRHRRPLVLDPIAEARQPLGASVEHARRRHPRRRPPRRELDLRLARRELEVGDVLAPEAAPDLALRRRRCRAVVPAPDEVEERRRELERPGLASLAEEHRDERRLRLRRRLLLPLAVVRRSAARGRRTRRRARRPRWQAGSRALRGRAACGADSRATRRSARGRARSPPRLGPPPRRSRSSPSPSSTRIAPVDWNASRG